MREHEISRRTLDDLQAGAGALTRKVEILTEREAQLAALEDLAKDRTAKVAELQEVRRQAFEELEKVRAERFESRMQIANKLKDELGPKIKTDVIESGMTSSYASIIAAALRGSGLHYTTLAPLFAAHMSPLELVEAAESNDVQAVTEAVEVTTERAMNVIAYLQQHSLADLIAAPVDDTVELSLLDGVDYKDSDNLSIGQRCTVVLPVLFTGHGELLIIDQPKITSTTRLLLRHWLSDYVKDRRVISSYWRRTMPIFPYSAKPTSLFGSALTGDVVSSSTPVN